MAILWNVPDVLTNPDGGVVEVHYSISDGLAMCDGKLTFTPDSTSESYVDFAELTKEQVVNWVKNTLTQEQIDAYEASIAEQLARVDTNTYPTAPWVQDAVALNKAMAGITDTED